MRVTAALMLATSLFAACSDTAGPDPDFAPDSAHGAGLLLPWSELDGTIIYATTTEVRRVNAVRRQVGVLRPIAANEYVIDIAISRDGSQVALVSLFDGGADRLTIVDVNTGAPLRFVDRAACPRFLPDNRMSYLRGDTVFVEGVRLTTLQPAVWSCPAWSDDGSFFIIALRDGASSRLYRVSMATLAPQPITEAATGGVGAAWYDPAIRPGGSQLAFVYAEDAPQSDIYVSNPDGSSRRKVAATARLFGLQWSPDGTQLLGISTVSAAPGLFLVRVSDGLVRKLANAPVYSAAWGR